MTVAEAGLSSVADYRRWLVRAAVALVTLRQRALELEAEEVAAGLDQTLARLESWLFSIAVVGEFKRGKSTFLNALLRAPILPTDSMPATATLSRVVYGRERRAELLLKSGERHAIDIAELPCWITFRDEESTARAEGVQEALIHWDTAFCWDNVQLVDTPGLNDPAAQIRLSQDVLPDTDAAIMVVSATEPFAESEAQLLAELVARIDPERLFFVVNMIDRIATTQVDRVVAHVESKVRDTLKRKLGNGHCLPPGRLFGLSAKLALDGRLRHDDAQLAQSRFPDFEAALRGYLDRDRAPAMLQPVMRALEQAAGALADRVTAGREDLAARRREEIDVLDAEASTLQALWVQMSDEITVADRRLVEESGVLAKLAGKLVKRASGLVGEAVEAVEIAADDFDQAEALKARLHTAIKRRVEGWISTQWQDLAQRVEAVAECEHGNWSDLSSALRAGFGQACPTTLVAQLAVPEPAALLDGALDPLKALPGALEGRFQPSPGSFRIGWEGALTGISSLFGANDKDARYKRFKRRQEAIPKLRADYVANATQQVIIALKGLNPADTIAQAVKHIGVNLRAALEPQLEQVERTISAREVELKVERARRETELGHAGEELAEAEIEIVRLHDDARAGFLAVSAVIGGQRTALGNGKDG